jgi:hypothetical protein
MRIGGFLLGVFVGLALSLSISGRFYLFGPYWYVLPAAFGFAGAFAVRRIPGGRALSGAGFAVGALAVVAAVVVCWWIVSVLANKHGWF